ncbi:39S ribosomal protein L30, mitochondrial [Bombina bombina]|uniref:39S ribosomal protein L30, mitochondrial n=1 Tax=Bombina bombina TaxID=8345 RepID=UPI00235B1856|nr:39S ribosomal protein L30, mitochondrial [Bombina bombina]XP_053563668.1 39S ribosomal protein L30, mitochondrial [Bombina bombina]XP_053563669.1 39S ribosomal protein L30, mitochondrial [Bombina bombina]
MATLCRNVQRNAVTLKLFTAHPLSLTWSDWIRHKFTKCRIPQDAFEPKPEDHEKYGGDPQQPHSLHLVTRIKSGIGRPYWEKEILEVLGLKKAHRPVVHKNITSVNEKLKMVKHLIRVQPLKLPYGLPAEEDMSDTYLKSTGELVIRKKLQPNETKSIES